MKTVKEVSEITGVSVRTLHYYDDIGLLKPTEVKDNGYRLYDDIAINKLQDILMFRELQFPLKEIKKLLDNPNFDSNKAIIEQIKLLELKKKHIEELISLAHKIKQERGDEMDFKVFEDKEFNDYAEEVKKRWGTTKEYAEYNEKIKGKTHNNLKESAKELMNLFAEIGMLKKNLPSDEKVQNKISSLQKFITDNYYTCTNDILKGLGQMYVSDERFRNNIDKAGGEGTAEFVNTAISIYCSK